MVATSTQAASGAASRAQGAHHSEPQPYASQAAARPAAMMRPSPNLQQQQQQQQAACPPMLLAPAPMQQRQGDTDEGVQQSQQKLESMYLHQAHQAPASRGHQQQLEQAAQQQQQALGLADVRQHAVELEDIDDDGTLAWAAADIREEESKKSAAAAAEAASKALLDAQSQGPPGLPDPPAQAHTSAQPQAAPLPMPPGYRGVTRHRSFVHERPASPFVQGLERAASFPGAQHHDAAQAQHAPPASGAPPGQLYHQGGSNLRPPAVAGGSSGEAPSNAAQASLPAEVLQPAARGASPEARLEVRQLV